MKSSPQKGSSINLLQLINNPIPQSSYHRLQLIIKQLQQYMQKCVKNRQYIEAQKAKDKIQEAHSCIKRRNSNKIIDKMMQNVMKLQAKHQEEKDLFIYEWDEKIALKENKFNQQIEKKKRMNEQQIIKLKQQVELALPQSYTPDDKIKSLRNQEQKLARQGKFLQAQKIKQQMQSREMMLEQKHRRLREANMKAMVDQLQQKQQRVMKQKQKQKKKVLDQLISQKNKKLKQLEERQAKQMKQLRWIHNQQIRLIN